jgi:hypothetical protein
MKVPFCDMCRGADDTNKKSQENGQDEHLKWSLTKHEDYNFTLQHILKILHFCYFIALTHTSQV